MKRHILPTVLIFLTGLAILAVVPATHVDSAELATAVFHVA